MKPVVIVWVCFLFCIRGETQPTHLAAENAYITAGAYSNHFTDAFSFSGNPACLGSANQFAVGLLAERKWMLKELGNEELTAIFPFRKEGLGIGFKRSGDADYNEKALEIGMGKKLGRLELGLCFEYRVAQAAGYHQTGYGSTGIGIRYHVSEKLITGWEMGLALFRGTGKVNTENGSRFFRMGFGFEWSPFLFLAFQIEKKSGMPLNVISSIEYRYNEQFIFSFGMNSMAGLPYFKAGWKKNRICIQLYSIYEPLLGFSPGILLTWENKNQGE